MGEEPFDHSICRRKTLQQPSEQEESRQHVCGNHLPPRTLYKDLDHSHHERDEDDVSCPANGTELWHDEYHQGQGIGDDQQEFNWPHALLPHFSLVFSTKYPENMIVPMSHKEVTWAHVLLTGSLQR